MSAGEMVGQHTSVNCVGFAFLRVEKHSDFIRSTVALELVFRILTY